MKTEIEEKVFDCFLMLDEEGAIINVNSFALAALGIISMLEGKDKKERLDLYISEFKTIIPSLEKETAIILRILRCLSEYKLVVVSNTISLTALSRSFMTGLNIGIRNLQVEDLEEPLTCRVTSVKEVEHTKKHSVN